MPASFPSSSPLAVPAYGENFSSPEPGIDDVQSIPLLSPQQLEQTLAPIALYPDTLVEQILMAATYPLQVVECARWLLNPGNAALTGDQLAQALALQSWDPSVKSLAPFPQVVQTMDANLQWTAQLGDSFIAQQADVMDAVQRLRQRAQAAGTLASTPQQVVAMQDQDILIEPARPDVVYVPYYNASTVYGSWPYPEYPPVYFASPRRYVVGPAVIGFSTAIIVVESLRGWHHWDWKHRRIDVDDRRYADLNRGRPPRTPGVWHHYPAHRQDVSPPVTIVRHNWERTEPSDGRRHSDGRHHALPVTAPVPHPIAPERPPTPIDTRPVPLPVPHPHRQFILDPALTKPVPLPHIETRHDEHRARDSEGRHPVIVQAPTNNSGKIERPASFIQRQATPRYEPNIHDADVRTQPRGEHRGQAPSRGDDPRAGNNDRRDNR